MNSLKQLYSRMSTDDAGAIISVDRISEALQRLRSGTGQASPIVALLTVNQDLSTLSSSSEFKTIVMDYLSDIVNTSSYWALWNLLNVLTPRGDVLSSPSEPVEEYQLGYVDSDPLTMRVHIEPSYPSIRTPEYPLGECFVNFTIDSGRSQYELRCWSDHDMTDADLRVQSEGDITLKAGVCSLEALQAEFAGNWSEIEAIRTICQVVPTHGTVTTSAILSYLNAMDNSVAVSRIRSSLMALNEVSLESGLAIVADAVRHIVNSEVSNGAYTFLDRPDYSNVGALSIVKGVLSTAINLLSTVLLAINKVAALIVAIVGVVYQLISAKLTKTRAQISGVSILPAIGVPFLYTDSQAPEPGFVASNRWLESSRPDDAKAYFTWALATYGCLSAELMSSSLYPIILPTTDGVNDGRFRVQLLPKATKAEQPLKWKKYDGTVAAGPTVTIPRAAAPHVGVVNTWPIGGTDQSYIDYSDDDAATIAFWNIAKTFTEVDWDANPEEFNLPWPTDGVPAGVLSALTATGHLSYRQSAGVVSSFISAVLTQAQTAAYDFKATWDDVFALYSHWQVAPIVTDALTNILCRTDRFQYVCPGVPVLHPVITPPNTSASSMWQAIAVAAGVAAVVVGSAFLAKRAICGRMVASVAKAQARYDQAAQAFELDPSTANRRKLIKANRGLNLWRSVSSLTGVATVGGRPITVGTTITGAGEITPSLSNALGLPDVLDNSGTNEFAHIVHLISGY